MSGDAAVNDDVSAGGGGRNHQRAGFNLVRNDGLGAAVQALHSADPDDISTGALDLRAHTVQEVRKVNDMRLFSRVIDEGLAFGLNGGEHHVHCRADGYHIKEHVSAGQRAFGSQHTADFFRFRADGAETLQGHRH